MSHFSVLVVTSEPPTGKVLDKVLGPYHEFECTGVRNEYVVDVDRTQSLQDEYERETQPMIRLADGTEHVKWDDQFFRVPTEEESKKIGPIAGTGQGDGLFWTSRDWGDGRGYAARVHFLPEGAIELDKKLNEAMTFLEFVISNTGYESIATAESPELDGEHKYGYIRLDENGDVQRVIKRTNPNAQWDWWSVGGRYTGKFISNAPCGASSSLEQAIVNIIDMIYPGFINGRIPGRCDSSRKGDLDINAMHALQMSNGYKWLDDCIDQVLKKKQRVVTRPEMERAIHLCEEHHEIWKALPEDQRPKGGAYRSMFLEWLPEDAKYAADVWESTWQLPELKGQTIEQWVRQAEPLTVWAVVKDGKWMQNGEMGWFGTSTNEVEDWPKVFKQIFDSIPNDHYLTIVDCHI